MKKLTLLFAFIAISVFLFAQGAIQKPQAQKAVKLSDLSIANQNSFNQLKSTKAIDYFCDFNSGEFSTFTVVNVDGYADDPGVPLDFSAGWIALYFVSDPSNTFSGSSSIFAPPGQADRWLISPAITITTGAILTWDGYSAGLLAGSSGEAYEVLISTTGGTAPSDFVDPTVFTIANEATDWTQHLVDLETAGYSNTTIYIAFRNVTNDGQLLLIDNIKVETPGANDLILEEIYPVFFGAGFYSMVPTKQVMDIFFGASVFNFGPNAQTNVTLNVDVNDGASSVYNETSTTLTIPSLASLDTDSLGIDALAFSPPPEIKDYTAVFTIGQDQVDDNPSNNVDTITFAVTDSVLARDRVYSKYLSPSLYGGADGDNIGTTFYLMNDDTVSSISVYIDPATTLGPEIVARLYQYDAAWVEVAASALYAITGGDIGEWLTLPLFPAQTVITGDFWYSASIECYWDGLGDLYFGADGTRPEIHDYQNSVSLNLDGTWYYATDGIPMIRLNLFTDYFVSANNVNNNNDFISIYPNPTNGTLNITNAENAAVYVYNILGEVVASIDNADAFSTIDMSNLSEGTYIVKILTDKNVITKKINLIK